MNLISNNPETLEVTGIKELSGAAAGAARDQIKQALKPAHNGLEVNLSETTFVDSSGLGAVVSALKYMGDKGRLHLCAVTPGVMAVLKLTRMDRVLKTFDSRQAAIAA